MHALRISLIYIFIQKDVEKKGKSGCLFSPGKNMIQFSFLKMVIYQLVEPGGAKCKRAFIKPPPPRRWIWCCSQLQNAPQRCWGANIWIGRWKLLMSKIHFTTWKDALLPAPSSLNELREIWNLLPLKVKFGQISKSICDQQSTIFWKV